MSWQRLTQLQFEHLVAIQKSMPVITINNFDLRGVAILGHQHCINFLNCDLQKEVIDFSKLLATSKIYFENCNFKNCSLYYTRFSNQANLHIDVKMRYCNLNDTMIYGSKPHFESNVTQCSLDRILFIFDDWFVRYSYT